MTVREDKKTRIHFKFNFMVVGLVRLALINLSECDAKINKKTLKTSQSLLMNKIPTSNLYLSNEKILMKLLALETVSVTRVVKTSLCSGTLYSGLLSSPLLYTMQKVYHRLKSPLQLWDSRKLLSIAKNRKQKNLTCNATKDEIDGTDYNLNKSEGRQRNYEEWDREVHLSLHKKIHAKKGTVFSTRTGRSGRWFDLETNQRYSEWWWRFEILTR